jgi:medium-chain acyl-[acyl-carrier-protein] hydrolase
MPNVSSKKPLWVGQNSATTHQRVRVFFFHHAGGSTAAFAGWKRQFPSDCEICSVRMPGHWEDLSEPRSTDILELVRRIDEDLKSALDRPFVVIGYSLGALIGFEWIRLLRKRGGLLPFHFFPMARVGPSVPPDEELVSKISSDKDFMEAVQRKYGELPAVLLKDPETLRIYLPMLRADIELFENYRYQGAEALPIPITAVGGSLDPAVTYEGLLSWKNETTMKFESFQFDGGHFFLNDHATEVSHLFNERIKPIKT